MTRLTHAEPPPRTQPFLGRYQLQKKLAVGGMAEIYLAQSRGAGGFTKQVVVKRILPQLAESEELFQMFLDEARIAATLQHANIVQVYDACEEGGEFFMAMEYLDGTDLRTLRRVLADNEMSIGWEHSLHIISSIASGLHYAHEKCAPDGSPLRIVHRDVSPQNIFLTREGSVKLVDFGIAQAEGRTTETARGTLKGKLAYMAPEQCASQHVDRRADIYSLGVILYELTTGRRLYSSKTEYQLINEIVEGKVKVPSTFMDYPAELESIVLRCLQKDPEDRYETARDIQADLDVFARDYQLICSTLGFSIFIEPLLEKTSKAAEERCKQRKEIKPVPVSRPEKQGARPSARGTSAELLWLPQGQESGHWPVGSNPKIPTPEPALTATPEPVLAVIPEPALTAIEEQQSSRANEIIEDFLSAKHSVPRVSTRRRPRATSTPLAVDTSYIQSRPNALEDQTRPVPSDLLERLRSEESGALQSEFDAIEDDEPLELDAIPRLARGSLAGERSVSQHLIRRTAKTSGLRQAGPSALPVSPSRPKGHLDPAETFIDHVDSSEHSIEFKAPKSPAMSLPKPAEEERIATALVSPAEFEIVAEEDISVTPSRGKLWIGLGSLAAAAAAAALLWGGADTSKADAPRSEPLVMPDLGSLTVVAASEAKVWLLLGKTPIDSLAKYSEAPHIIRVEHDGYQSQELESLPSTWQRDPSGARFAEVQFSLLPAESATRPTALDAETFSKGHGSAAGRPANLRIRSTPNAANAWLYVGSTPNLQISNLPTDQKVELRVTRGVQPPIYRVLRPDQFDSRGQARLELSLPPTVPAPMKKSPQEIKGSESDLEKASTKPKNAARAKAGRQPSARNSANKGKGAVLKSKKLKHPTPNWAQ